MNLNIIDEMKTLFRSGQRFLVKKSWWQFAVFNRQLLDVSLINLLQKPDNLIDDNHQATILKSDATAKVALITLNQQGYIIKRYNIKNFWHGIKRAIRPTRATYCWRNAHRLLFHNIATPVPVAMIEKRFGPFRRQGYYVYEYIPGPQGFDVFRDKPGPKPQLQLCAKNTITLIKKLFQHQMSHGDLKASNFIYQQQTPYFIDLDAMRYHRVTWLSKRRNHRDIKRFMENWQNVPIQSLFEELL